MKTKLILVSMYLFFLTINLFSQSNIGGCKESQSSSITSYDDPTCQGLSMYYPSGNGHVEISVNFVFLKPITGVGRWDTISQQYCQAMLDEINFMLDSLMPPMLTLPNPAPFINKALIKFNIKSISKIATNAYDSSGHLTKGRFISDPNAINVIYGVTNDTSWAPGRASGNEITMTDGNWGPPASQHGKPERMLLMHELLHSCGLWHTDWSYGIGKLAVLNPNGSILPNLPVNDYWLEDTIQYNTSISNNIMANVWSTRRYLSPKQIYYLHYYLRTSSISKAVSSYPNYPNYTCVADHNNDWTVSGVDTLGGIFLSPPGDLIISAGSNITLLNCMVMTSGSKIIVEPGAKFNVINGSINTFGCAVQWRGIEVRSTAWSAQPSSINTSNMPPNNVGMVVLNNAKISNAVRAVTLGELDVNGNYINGTAAGIILSENTKYINNIIGIEFDAYTNTNDNLSYFKRDTFIVDPNFKGQTPIAAIRIFKNHGVDILGCYFSETDFVTSTAIEVFAGSIKMKDHCTSISGTTCNGTLTRNTFIGFVQAIDIYNTVMTSIPSKIDHVIIDQHVLSGATTVLRDQMRGGIYIGKNFGSEIVNCTIKTLRKPTTTSSTPITYGLYLDNSSGYVVENNVFTGSSSWKTVGVCVNNSGYAANSIYNNTITAHGQGIWAQNINYNPVNNSTGLIMNCDDFVNGEYNIGVQSQYGSNAGVAPTQGVANTAFETYNVRNTYDLFYSTCTNNQENKFRVETQNAFVVTSHGSFKDSTVFHPWPQTNNSCSNQNKVHYVFGANPVSTRPNYCPINNLPSLSPQSLQSEYSGLDNKKTSLSQVYQLKLDGGNTDHLLGLIGSGMSFSALRDSLLSKDFLSDTVLQSYMLKQNVPHAHLNVLFEKNAPLHPNLWQIISLLDLPESTLAHWDSIQHSNKLSTRNGLESEIQLSSTQRDLVLNEKVRRFLNDSAGPIYDSIIKIYSTIEQPGRKIMLADAYIAAELYDSAAVVINDLENESESHEDICHLLRLTLALSQSVAYADTLRADSSNYFYLHDAANSSLYLKQGYSRSLLREIYDQRTEEVRLEPSDNTLSSRVAPGKNVTKANSETQMLEAQNEIKIFPNPASNQIVIELGPLITLCTFKITDLTGKSLLTGAFNAKSIINLGSLLNGVYLLYLYEDETLVKSHKVVVIK